MPIPRGLDKGRVPILHHRDREGEMLIPHTGKVFGSPAELDDKKSLLSCREKVGFVSEKTYFITYIYIENRLLLIRTAHYDPCSLIVYFITSHPRYPEH